VRRAQATDGTGIAVYDLGGGGEPVLLAHATGFHAHVWEPLAARLADRYHAYAFDFRGHGRSHHPDYGYPWRDFALDVLAAVDALGLGGGVLAVGHSKGAAALLMAEQDRPATFRALYCYEPIVVPVVRPTGPSPDNPLSVGARKRRDAFASREEAYANFAGKAPFDRLHPDALRAYVEHGFEEGPEGGVRLRCRPEYEARVYAMGFAHDAFARFGEVACPVTIACGEHTDAITPAVVERQAAALPHARTEVLPGLGHFGPLEDPGAVAASIRRAFTSP
jgi:pimeloyl-ACP methyl ester carboxylesterase